jgi:hypothetical protein
MRNVADYIPLLPGEYFEPMKGWEDLYYISNKSRVFSFHTKLKYNYRPVGLLKPCIDNIGYSNTTLWSGCKSHRLKTHRLVALQFVPNPDNKPDVHHINHIKTDNRPENLQWVTHQENIRYSYDSGLRKPIKRNPMKPRVFSPETKEKMSKAKQGKLHPKFNAIYVIDGTAYYSANSAAKALRTHANVIQRRSKDERYPNYQRIPQ